jgi:anti-anti-sigma factor
MSASSHIELAPTSSAPSRARQHLRTLAPSDAAWLGDAELVLSELVANAVEHGEGTVTVDLDVDGATVRIAVTTAATAAVPLVLDVGPADAHGRGLAIVASLATRWGHDTLDSRRTVWALLGDASAARPRFRPMTVGPSECLRVEVVEEPERGRAIVIGGEIDPGTAPQLRTVVEQAIGTGGDVVLDLTDVTFFDSAGVSLIVSALQDLRSSGRQLVVRRPSAIVRRVLEVAQLTSELGFE